MIKLVINSDFGGFGLSDEAIREYFRRKNWNLVEKVSNYDQILFYRDFVSNDTCFWAIDLERNDTDLVAIVEQMGDSAGSKFSSLKIVEIPENVEWELCEYDGREWIAEKHRTWR